MKLSLNWLKEFVEIKVSPEKLAEKLTLAGFEVEKIDKLSEKVKNIVVGEILEIKKHPNADKLQIVKVKVKQGVKEIVCGASNIKEGQKAPVALVGATLANMEIKEAEIRGVKSFGMLCAEDELGIGDDHSGIYILNPEVKITDDIKKVLGLDDTIFDIEVTPNRGDCLSVLGLARESLTILNEKFKIRSEELKFKISNYTNSKIENLMVEIKDQKLCPKYTAAVIRGIKIKESPEWIKARLRNNGIRPINNVVDITNYVMLELGQPLHAFDFEKIKSMKISNFKSQISNKFKIQNSKFKTEKIIVRQAKKGEKIIAIDDKERELEEGMLIIANNTKPIAIAGVMGGKESEISENTRDIILESAQFDLASVRQTSKKLGLRSESSVRFERGVDWNITEVALERAINLIKEIAEGIESKERIRITKKPIYLRRVINLSPDFISKLLGVEISKEKIKNIFLSLGFKVSEFYSNIFAVKKAQDEIIVEAKKLIGKKYKYGAKEKEAPKYFDCSSFIKYVYGKIGIVIPRCSIEQAEIGREVKKTNLQEGDLIFARGNGDLHYSYNFPNGLDHAGIYIGSNKIIHAEKRRNQVIEENLKEFLEKREWVTAKRIMETKDDKLIITVPSWREDVKIPADLAEEAGRIYDYNKMKPTFLNAELKPVLIKKDLILENKIKEILTAIGYDEVYNYSFYGAKNIKDENKHLKIENPINPDQEFLRTTLRPKIEENLEKNLKYFDEVKIFEIGNVFFAGDKELPEERKNMIVAVAFKKSFKEDIFRRLKGALEILAEKLNINQEELNYQKENHQKINIKIKNDLIGDLEISENKGSFELDFSKLFKYCQEKKVYQKISPYPSVTRDLALVLDKNIAYSEVLKIIKIQSSLIQEVNLFDVFENDKLGKNKKSLAFHIVFQSWQKTLTSEEIEKEINKILNELKKMFNAQLRM